MRFVASMVRLPKTLLLIGTVAKLTDLLNLKVNAHAHSCTIMLQAVARGTIR